MFFAIAFSLHVLAAIVWVGGMFFAYLCLRPAAGEVLEPPARLPLLAAAMRRFFRWVWIAVLLLLATGFGLAFATWCGIGAWPHHVTAMMVLGIVMILVFLHLYFAPFRRLGAALAAGETAAAGGAMSQVRRIVGINLALGLVVSLIAASGRYI